MKKLNYLTIFVLVVSGLELLQVPGICSANIPKLNLDDPPLIVWTNPSKEYSILKTERTTIKATIKSALGVKLVQVFLNDVLYGEPEMNPSLTESGSFIITKTVILEPGDNSIYIIATNNEGTIKSEKRFLTVPLLSNINDSASVFSTAAPVIVWTDPMRVRTTLNSPRTNIKAILRSSTGVSSVSLYLNGILYGEPEMTPSLTETGSFLLQKSINFEPGEDSIYLEAKSLKGTTISDKRYFSVPAPAKPFDVMASVPVGPPVISWASPTRERTTLNSVKTEVQAIIKSQTGVNSVVLYLNEIRYGEPEMISSPTEVGTYIISKTVILEPGMDSLYFVAISSTGTTTSEKRFFSVPFTAKDEDAVKISSVPAPIISWTTPVVKSTNLRSATVNVKATIKSVTDLTSVIVFLNGIPQGEAIIKPSSSEAQSYVLEQSLNFKQIENTIYINAKNNGGSSQSESRLFICPPSSLAANQTTNPNISEAVETETMKTKPGEKQTEPATAVPSPQTTLPVITTSSAPVVTWTSPSGSHTTLDSYNATVKANIKSISGLTSVMLYLNGISKGIADVLPVADQKGSYMVEKNITFGPGENNIYLVAANNEGASKSEIRFFSNPEAVVPAITWSNPESPNSLVNQESLPVSACIKSSTNLRSVKLLVNGNIQIEDNVFQVSGSGDCNYNWKTSVVLREGDNSIFIIAANAAGTTTSEKRVIRLTSVSAEKRLALVLGNSQYQNRAPLKNPVNDANLMEATLKDLGFHIIKRLDASYEDMKSAIREFENKLPEYNVALFYYAGHGNQVDGNNYLIPVDAKLEKPGDCKFEAIEVNLIVDEFERYPENTNIVILDACRNNPFASWVRGGEAGFRAMSFTSGTVVAYATAQGATAADGKGANGLYTEELVKQMLIPQSLNDVFMNTRVQVRKLSSNQQVPSETNQLNGPFFFRK